MSQPTPPTPARSSGDATARALSAAGAVHAAPSTAFTPRSGDGAGETAGTGWLDGLLSRIGLGRGAPEPATGVPTPPAQPVPRRALITAFQSFSGRSRNGSTAVQAWLQANWGHRSDTDFPAPMPVEWNTVPTLLTPALLANRRLVVGLGEASPGEIRLETRAQNMRDGTDEATPPVTFNQSPIEAGGPASRNGMGLVIPSSWPAGLPHASVTVRTSTDAGQFLCNRTLWILAGTSAPVRGFIHLPPQGTDTDVVYAARLGPTVAAILDASWPP